MFNLLSYLLLDNYEKLRTVVKVCIVHVIGEIHMKHYVG
jgi:hypothetical protein